MRELCRAFGGSNTPHWIGSNILDVQRGLSVKIAVENGKIYNKTTMGETRELVRFGLLMKRIALEWILSRRWREDLAAPPQTWE